MKKPNKSYRFLKRRSSKMAAAFTAVHRPLMSVFRTQAEKDAADNFHMPLSKRGIQLVMAVLKSWDKDYKGPKLSYIFSLLNHRRKVDNTEFHGPKLD